MWGLVVERPSRWQSTLAFKSALPAGRRPATLTRTEAATQEHELGRFGQSEWASGAGGAGSSPAGAPTAGGARYLDDQRPYSAKAAILVTSWQSILAIRSAPPVPEWVRSGHDKTHAAARTLSWRLHAFVEKDSNGTQAVRVQPSAAGVKKEAGTAVGGCRDGDGQGWAHVLGCRPISVSQTLQKWLDSRRAQLSLPRRTGTGWRPMRPHDQRHHSATTLLKNGASGGKVMDRHGGRTVEMVNRYRHLLEAQEFAPPEPGITCDVAAFGPPMEASLIGFDRQGTQ